MEGFFMQTKILVLDDEKEIADLVALYLNNEGYEYINFMTARMRWNI